MIRPLLLIDAAIAADALQQSHALLPFISLLALLSLWIMSEIGRCYRDLPEASADEQEDQHDFQATEKPR